jgi:hypothetical protein
MGGKAWSTVYFQDVIVVIRRWSASVFDGDIGTAKHKTWEQADRPLDHLDVGRMDSIGHIDDLAPA